MIVVNQSVYRILLKFLGSFCINLVVDGVGDDTRGPLVYVMPGSSSGLGVAPALLSTSSQAVSV